MPWSGPHDPFGPDVIICREGVASKDMGPDGRSGKARNSHTYAAHCMGCTPESRKMRQLKMSLV